MKAGAGVLVIEDNFDVREAVMEVLADRGYPAEGASTGEEALALLRAAPSPPRLILLDLALPGMDAHHFRKAQSEDVRLGAIPIVILSGNPRGHELAIELGADAFLEKPVEIDQLLSTVDRFWRSDAFA
jgi:CheY-like chemotaxis protein